MNTEEIAKRLEAINTDLVEKIGSEPWDEAELAIDLYGNCYVHLRGPLEDDLVRVVRGYTPADCLDDADRIIAEMPDVSTHRARYLVRKVAELLEYAKIHNLGAEFEGPLQATMERLASNAIAAE